jgi:hypothetical protein
MLELMSILAVPEHRDGRVHFRDVVTLLTKHAFAVDFEGSRIPVSIRERWDAQYPRYHKTKSASRFTTREGFAAMRVQRAWRRRAAWLALVRSVAQHAPRRKIQLFRGKGKPILRFGIGGLPGEDKENPPVILDPNEWQGGNNGPNPEN